MNEQQLRQAAANGNIEQVKELHSKGADLHASGAESGKTALHRAAENGRLDVVQFLLSQRANVNCMDINGNTPLNCVIQSNAGSLADKIAVIQCLITSKAGILNHNLAGQTPLMNFSNIRDQNELVLKPHLQNEVGLIIREMKRLVAEQAKKQGLSASIRRNGEVIFADAETLLNDRNSYQLPKSGQLNINVIDRESPSINLAPHK